METTELNIPVAEVTDFYELFQISPSATMETIHRIYRFWAARYHPDNPKTGNDEMFFLVREVYDVLRDPERRAHYDATRNCQSSAPSSLPLSLTVDFMDAVEGEMNRRFAVLAILYSQRRADARHPEVSLRDLESTLGFPREYLDFTTWYLVQKHYMHRADNSDFAITVNGVDYVEANRPNVPTLSRLLSNGRLRLAGLPVERRINRTDRRMGLPDVREARIERRNNKKDRRSKSDAFRIEDFTAG